MRPLKTLFLALLVAGTTVAAHAAPASWVDSLEPLPAAQWSRARAAHLLERAGFGGTPTEIVQFASMSPRDAVQTLVRYKSINNPLPAFQESNAFDPGLDPFAPSRPAATDMAKETGEARGVRAKPEGNRKLQQVADRYTRFFYQYDAAPLFIVDAGQLNPVDRDEDFELLLERLRDMRSYREFFGYAG